MTNHLAAIIDNPATPRAPSTQAIIASIKKNTAHQSKLDMYFRLSSASITNFYILMPGAKLFIVFLYNLFIIDG